MLFGRLVSTLVVVEVVVVEVVVLYEVGWGTRLGCKVEREGGTMARDVCQSTLVPACIVHIVHQLSSRKLVVNASGTVIVLSKDAIHVTVIYVWENSQHYPSILDIHGGVISHHHATTYITTSSPLNLASLNACSCILFSILSAQNVAALVAFVNLSPRQSAPAPAP